MANVPYVVIKLDDDKCYWIDNAISHKDAAQQYVNRYVDPNSPVKDAAVQLRVVKVASFLDFNAKTVKQITIT
jgi:hypothetical protein